MLVPPAVKVPQFMELRGCVHPLSEYTPKFADEDTVPVEYKGEDVLRAAKVVSVKATPIITNAAIAVVIESLRFAVIVPCSKRCVLSLNKSYCVPELTAHLNNTATYPEIHAANLITISVLSELKREMIELSPVF